VGRRHRQGCGRPHQRRRARARLLGVTA
jgi:hypothetical protein